MPARRHAKREAAARAGGRGVLDRGSERLCQQRPLPPGIGPALLDHLPPCGLAIAAAFVEPAGAEIGIGDDHAHAPLAKLARSEEHTSELQSRENLVCRLLLEKKKQKNTETSRINSY